MSHELPLLVDIAVALAYALVGGVVAKRLHLPPLVGYLLAGVAIGPFTPGFRGDQATIETLAELGVVFLLFGVGLHFSFSDLWSVRHIALPGAFLQMSASAALGYGLGRFWGWTSEASLLLGLAISVASTVVLLRALVDNGLLDSLHGRVAVGWLVFQDLATVTLLILLPAVLSTNAAADASSAPWAFTKTAIFLALMLGAGRRVIPWLLKRVVWLQSRELFILVGLTLAVGTALLSSSLFGISLALGAFMAGVVVSESPYSHQIGADLLPFREAFAVIFFVSVGMLVNPPYLLEHWREVLALSTLIVIGNALIGACAGFIFPYPARTALVVGAGLSQIGEFSFIVGQTGMAIGVLEASQYSLILAGALVSISLNSFMFRLIGPVEGLLRARPALWRFLNRHGPKIDRPQQPLRDHVVIIGWGRVGRHVSDVLGTIGVPRLVIESDSTLAEQLTAAKVPTLFGEAGNSEILRHAELPHARSLVLTVPDEPTAAIAVAAARQIAPDLHIIARASTAEGARHLSELGANEIVRPEFEAGLQVLHRTLQRLGYPLRRIQEYSDAIRRQELAPGTDGEHSRLLGQLVASELDLEWMPIPAGSTLDGRSIAASNLRPHSGVSVVAVSRAGVVTSNPSPEVVMQAGDEVAVIGTPPQLEAARALARLR